MPRIYIVHDEVKDKAFDLELSWVGEITGGKHELVPPEVFVEAEKYAKVCNLLFGKQICPLFPGSHSS